jgi:YHS domain-containing protein
MKRISLLTALAALTIAVHAQTPQKTNVNVNSDHVALGGYDPVAYFEQQRPVKGSAAIAAQNNGATYWFSTLANKKRFVDSPSSYQPQYGGWCAYAMGAEGEKVEVNPETFKVLDGKLYLFYNKFLHNTLETWNKNENELKTKADKNWTTFSQR